MGRDCILSIDQGTTNTKALLVDRSGVPVYRASDSVAIVTTTDGFTEQDPELIWQSVAKVITCSCEHAQAEGFSIQAIAISNQRETALAWDRGTGRAAASAISWQCSRGAEICTRLGGRAEEIRAKTGLPLAPLISATKWAWLLENDKAVQNLNNARRLCLGTVDTWLIHKLTRGAVYATDFTNASRTGLLNLSALAWDHEILDLFGISLESLPKLRPSSFLLGYCRGIPELDGVPVMSAIGDSHGAAFGHGHYAPGTIKATYGTGSSLMALTPSLVPDTPRLARTIAWSIGDLTQYALEGNIAMTGSAIQWLGEFLGFTNPTLDLIALAATVEDADGIFFVPAMVGLGAPYWDAQARGTISGLSRHHSSAHLARAAVESIAFQVADVFFAMEAASSVHFIELQTDGGATRNTSLMQFQANILDRPVLRARNEELSALGAAWLSGLALGWWKSLHDLEALSHSADRFEPAFDAAQRDEKYLGWKMALSRMLSDKAVPA